MPAKLASNDTFEKVGVATSAIVVRHVEVALGFSSWCWYMGEGSESGPIELCKLPSTSMRSTKIPTFEYHRRSLLLLLFPFGLQALVLGY
jgi:hypothetical protein